MIEIVRQGSFSTGYGRVVNLAAASSMLDMRGHVDMTKVNPVFFDSFSNSYFEMGPRVGEAWKEGKTIKG